MSKSIFNCLAIVGVGLIGSSIARAARQSGAVKGITVIDNNPEHIAQAMRLTLGDRYSEDLSAVSDADLVILATPSGSYVTIMQQMAEYLAPNCVLSDTGSVKLQVLQDLQPLTPPHVHLIPAHPIAGTEYSGPEAGQVSLFHNRYCVLTPPTDTKHDKITQLADFWRCLGAIVDTMDAGHHDRVLAMTSHLPHFISFALVRTADTLEENLRAEQVSDMISATEVMKYSAGGFRDLTRIAHADPAMWRDVLLYNRDAILEMLHRFQQDLSALAAFTARGDGEKLESWVRESRHIREMIMRMGQAGRMVYNDADTNQDAKSEEKRPNAKET